MKLNASLNDDNEHDDMGQQSVNGAIRRRRDYYVNDFCRQIVPDLGDILELEESKSSGLFYPASSTSGRRFIRNNNPLILSNLLSREDVDGATSPTLSLGNGVSSGDDSSNVDLLFNSFSSPPVNRQHFLPQTSESVLVRAFINTVADTSHYGDKSSTGDMANSLGRHGLLLDNEASSNDAINGIISRASDPIDSKLLFHSDSSRITTAQKQLLTMEMKCNTTSSFPCSPSVRIWWRSHAGF
mmetsp:Transcript_7110/g.10070  ORF Transcript_7110/g.10070 Transcript_7110/m.10070 type:complete len:242 (-) Transcript_7110:646-1371(-)